MRAFLISSAVALCALSGTAFAAGDYPDLRGTWKGDTKAVFIDSGDSDAKPVFDNLPVSIEITEQQDNLFAGQFELKGVRPIVGVMPTPTTILWSEPGGFVQGEVIDGDTIKACYVRISEFNQLAGCEEYQRSK